MVAKRVSAKKVILLQTLLIVYIIFISTVFIWKTWSNPIITGAQLKLLFYLIVKKPVDQ